MPKQKSPILTEPVTTPGLTHYTKIQCPICRDSWQMIESNTQTKLYICNSCLWDINYCNKHKNHNCLECINTSIHAKLSDNPWITTEIISEKKSYGCHKGSRLAKICKVNGVSKVELTKYIRWKIL